MKPKICKYKCNTYGGGLGWASVDTASQCILGIGLGCRVYKPSEVINHLRRRANGVNNTGVNFEHFPQLEEDGIDYTTAITNFDKERGTKADLTIIQKLADKLGVTLQEV